MAKRMREPETPVEVIAGLTTEESKELADLEKAAANRNGDVASHKMLRLGVLREKAKVAMRQGKTFMQEIPAR